MPERPATAVTIAKLAGCCLLASVVVAALLFPVAGGFGLMSNRASEVVANGSAQLLEGEVPAVTTMVDAKGNTIAWLYDQRRFEVPSDKIANTMKLAIVSIEDKRFAEHNGVDWKGTLTGLAGYASGDVDTRGGSTIEQQYVKNYQLLVIAQTDAEKRAAIETTPARKLREIRMALTLDKTFTKPEILTRYLNLVSFGNNAFGVQDAAQTYFGINASDLNWQQAALLAGLVQSTSTLNPYTNPDGALARRNLVLDTMIENLPNEADALRAAKAEPLGILPQPNELPRGCIAAGDRAFFCDYVQAYLSRAGHQQGAARQRRLPDPHHARPRRAEPGQVRDRHLREPHPRGHRQRDERDQARQERAQGRRDGQQPHLRAEHRSRRDHAAAAVLSGRRRRRVDLQDLHHRRRAGDGHGHQRQPRGAGQIPGQGHGQRRRQGLPQGQWCVINAGNYRGSMSVTDALATSPNTAFAKLIQQIGVQRTVDMAVKLGLRSYAEPGSARDYDPESNESLADFVKRQNLGSFTLGPFALNALELSNVAATLASGGTWCPPNPIDKLIDRNGNEVSVTTETCDQVVPEGLANTLANAMSKDALGGGTAAGLRRCGRLESAGLRKDRHHRGAPVVGLRRLHQPVRRGQLHLRRLHLAVGPVLVPAAALRRRQPLRR